MRSTWLVLVAVVLAVPEAAGAQQYAVDRGSWLVGGTAGMSSSKYDHASERTTQISFAPRLQYFVVPGLAVGGKVEFQQNRTGSARWTLYGVGPDVTYYFGRENRSVYPFVGGTVSIARTEVSGADVNPGPSTSKVYDVHAGILSMLARSVGVDTRLYYGRVDQSGPNDMSTFGLALGVSAFVF